MAETVKKSRIVSETDENLEESLLEEFNLRLKKCMSRENLVENEDAHTYENIHMIKTNGVTTCHHDSPQITSAFLKNERDNYDVMNGYREKLEINGIKTDNDNEHMHTKPSLNLPTTCLIELPSPTEFSENHDPKTVKDRMLLSTDDVSCLLFTQTVTSPMLTPSEENIDFLKGFRHESNQTIESSDSSKTEASDIKQEPEHVFEKNDEQESEHIYENVELLNEQNMESSDVKEVTAKFIENESYHFEKVIENHEIVTDLDENIIVTDLDEDSKGIGEHVELHERFEISNTDDIENVKIEQIIKDPVNTCFENNIEQKSTVQALKSQFLSEPCIEDLKPSVRIDTNDELDELKSLNIMKQITKFESNTITKLQESTNICIATNTCASTISESRFVQQTTTEMHTTDDTSLKKKKTKKTKNHHEKENISVNETNTNEKEESCYNVNVKNLCRSFGDLSKIDVEQYHNRKNNERTKSSFNKFDALQKKNVLNNQTNEHEMDDSCKGCGKPVFQMERIVAERCMWHRNCFRCRECSKQLLVDNFESHEGSLYCKPHFKALFAPKIIEDELPTSDKPDLGLEELHSLNVKERFQVFENPHTMNDSYLYEKSPIKMERSPSILSKLARFQAKGMDIGVTDDSLNGVPLVLSESEEEEQQNEDMPDGEDADLVRAKRVQKERPFHFVQMSDVKSKWEQGNQQVRDDRREERKQEIQNIRSRLFLGKQGKMKEAYQQAIAESESNSNLKREVPVEPTEAAKKIKDKFEKGEVIKNNVRNKDTEDMSVFESAISKNSRSMFQELDANGGKAPTVTSPTPPKLGNSVRNAREAYIARQATQDTVKATDQVDEITVHTADIQDRFKFFETYKEPQHKRKEFRMTPPREGQNKSSTPEKEIPPNLDIVRSDEIIEDSHVAKSTHTTTKMLSKFRQMEESLSKQHEPHGLKPLKRFTPPREPIRKDSSSERESDSEEQDSEDELDNGRIPEQDLIEAQKAARAQKLRAKFERWEENEIKRDSSVNLAEEIGDDQSQVETARSLRAKFESLRDTNSGQKETQRVKVNRFVTNVKNAAICESCRSRVYPLEEISIHGHIFHKNCFRCKECKSLLRMDSYSYNQGLLFCTTHFKRLFISKGNYDTGFGLQHHKDKWNSQ